MKVLDIFGLQIQNPYDFFYWINSAIFILQLATTEKILVESVEGGVYGSGGRVGGGGGGKGRVAGGGGGGCNSVPGDRRRDRHNNGGRGRILSLFTFLNPLPLSTV